MLAIKAGLLITGRKEEPLENVAVIIEDSKIESICSFDSQEVNECDEIIEAGEMTVMPGLINAHTHTSHGGGPNSNSSSYIFDSVGKAAVDSYSHALMDLAAGFTTLRDASSRDYVDIEVRNAIENGKLTGPRLIASGEGLATTGGHIDSTKNLPHSHQDKVSKTNIYNGPEEARRAARYQLKMGADWIKLTASLSEYARQKGGVSSPEPTYEEVEAICQVAHEAGKKVGAHCHGGKGADRAIKAGVDCLEHGRFLTDNQLDKMAEKDMFLVPTLSTEQKTLDIGGEEALSPWQKKSHENMYETVSQAHQKGVKIGTGDDGGWQYVEHGTNAFEMKLLEKAGLSPADIIVSATKIGSELVDMADEIGTVEEGKLADLIIIDGNPLEGIEILQETDRVKKVLREGKVVIDKEHRKDTMMTM